MNKTDVAADVTPANAFPSRPIPNHSKSPIVSAKRIGTVYVHDVFIKAVDLTPTWTWTQYFGSERPSLSSMNASYQAKEVLTFRNSEKYALLACVYRCRGLNMRNARRLNFLAPLFLHAFCSLETSFVPTQGSNGG